MPQVGCIESLLLQVCASPTIGDEELRIHVIRDGVRRIIGIPQIYRFGQMTQSHSLLFGKLLADEVCGCPAVNERSCSSFRMFPDNESCD